LIRGYLAILQGNGGGFPIVFFAPFGLLRRTVPFIIAKEFLPNLCGILAGILLFLWNFIVI
jgi:hypothetical protein